jgi:nitrous oxidase accessory protein NosD
MELVVKKLCILCILILVLFSGASVRARIIHVPADSSTIQAGINGAVDGDTVLVARGRYCESIDFLGKSILVASHYILDGDSITIDSTVIQGEDSIPSVRFCSHEGISSTLSGFTITHATEAHGTGIYCSYSSPTVRTNIVVGNTLDYADGCGGGISCDRLASPIIQDNMIVGNSARLGGGIYCYDRSSPQIISNNIMGNLAAAGGGVYCEEFCAPSIRGNTIQENYAQVIGGGIHCQLGCQPTISENILVDDSAGYFGGGIALWDLFPEEMPIVSFNIVRGNNAGEAGGGIYFKGSTLFLKNNIICDNFATSHGGGIFCEFTLEAVISNNTVVRNEVSGQGAGISIWYDLRQVVIVGNIISGCAGGEGIACGEASPLIRHNDVWGNPDGNFYNCPVGIGDTSWGINFNGISCDSFYNIIRDPLFADTVDFQLLCNSPCIDAGDPDILVDLDSGGCRIDVGAKEYLYVLGDANSDGIIEPKSPRAGAVTVGDIVFVINYLFQQGPKPCPFHAADTDCDGIVDSEDLVCLINYLFRGGDIPC